MTKAGILSLVFIVIVLSSSMVLAEEAGCPSSEGLVAWYPAEGNVNDVAGDYDGAAVRDVSYVPGKWGRAFSFIGKDDSRVEVTDPGASALDLSEGYTVMAWVNAKENRGLSNSIVRKGNNYALTVGSSDRRVYFRTASGNLIVPIPYGSRLPINEWTHVAGTVNVAHTSAKIYIDGVLRNVESVTSPETLRIGDSPLVIGKSFNGSVDEVKIFGRELSREEIEAAMEEQCVRGEAPLKDEAGPAVPSEDEPAASPGEEEEEAEEPQPAIKDRPTVTDKGGPAVEEPEDEEEGPRVEPEPDVEERRPRRGIIGFFRSLFGGGETEEPEETVPEEPAVEEEPRRGIFAFFRGLFGGGEEEEVETVELTVACTDTDPSNDLSIRGTASGIAFARQTDREGNLVEGGEFGIFEDRCHGDGSGRIVQFYCTSAHRVVASTSVGTCEFGCVEGACTGSETG